MRVFQLDLGNSFVKWRELDCGEVFAKGGFPAGAPPPEVMGRWAAIDQFQVASVASASSTEALMHLIEKTTSARVLNAVTLPSQLGLTNSYKVPGQMGVDRWLAMLAVWQGCHQPFIVVDAGSAVTIDFVGAGGQHEGGYILPGRNLMLNSLQAGTSRVRFQAEGDAAFGPGTDTQQCVARGLSLINRGLVSQIREAAACRGITELWVTGGDANCLQDAGLGAHHHRDLVLDGLAVYCENVFSADSSQ